MKKLIAIALSLILAMVIFPAASADSDTTRVLNDFDTIGRVAESSVINGGTSGIIDYTAIDSSYTDGNVYSITPNSGGSNCGFTIDPSWTLGNPVTMKFQLWTTAAITTEASRTGLSANVASAPADNAIVLGATTERNMPINTVPTWVTYDLTQAAISQPNVFLQFCPGESGQPIYIDNVTLEYADAASVPANIAGYETMYDWESDMDGASTVASPNGNDSFSIAREAAAANTALIPDSTYGLTLTYTWQPDGYVEIAAKPEIADAASLRVAANLDAQGANQSSFGIKYNGTVYTISTSASLNGWFYFEYKTYTDINNPDNTLYLTRDMIKDIQAITCTSMIPWANRYIDDIQYGILEQKSADTTPTATVEIDGNPVSVRTQMVKGGSMRYPTSYSTVDGIRYMAKFNNDDIQAILDMGYTIDQYVTEFSYNNLPDKAYTYAGGFYKVEDGYSYVAGSIVNIKPDHITGTFNAICWLVFKKGEQEVRLTTNANDNARSIAYIAYCVKNSDEYDTLSAEKKAKVDKYAAEYVPA